MPVVVESALSYRDQLPLDYTFSDNFFQLPHVLIGPLRKGTYFPAPRGVHSSGTVQAACTAE
jgi:hypothetical protein